MHVHSAYRWLTGLTVGIAAACGSAPDDQLSSKDHAAVVNEIQQVLHEYREIALRQDLEPAEAVRSFLTFYSKDLVLAGDGKIAGGYDDWGRQLRRFIDARQKMLSWEWHDVRISVLSKTAATATFEFEHSELRKAGDTLSVKGVWTYVFRSENGKWKIIQSNGTHLPA